MCNCQSKSCCSSSCGCGCQSKGDWGCSSSGCCSEKSSCSDESKCCEHAKKLLYVADAAWMEVLKEKIKDHIRLNDKKIDEMAAIVAEANHARWHEKMANKKSCATYEEKLKSLFGSCSSGCDTKK